MKFKRLLTAMLSALLIIVSVVAVSSDTVYEYSGLQYTLIDNSSVSVCGWNGSNGNVSIPAVINNRKVVEIESQSFMDNSDIVTVNFSNGTNLERIGSFAFCGSSLSGNIIIPKSVTSIDTAAFEECANLQIVEFKSSASAIPAQCFKNCSALVSVTLNSNIETIGSLAFANCTSLEYLFIPNSVTSISSSAFKNDKDLVIGCSYGSYAYEYAKQNNIAFRLLDDVKLGDTDLNGVININDATMVQMDDVQLITLNDLEKKAADVNRDGEITIRDATLIQMYLANIITSF